MPRTHGWAPQVLLACWALILPWDGLFTRGRRLQLGAVGVLALALGAGVLSAKEQPVIDLARPLELGGMPLVASDLISTSDGSLWFSGLPTPNTPRLGGRGWMGYQLELESQRLRPLISHPVAHIWSPMDTEEGVVWGRGPGADLGARPVPCGQGYLKIIATEMGPQVGFVDADEEIHQLTWTRAHHASPACDEERGRAWFLSDRGVGVRALRLWWVPLPEFQ